jgi:hypothetical protein
LEVLKFEIGVAPLPLEPEPMANIVHRLPPELLVENHSHLGLLDCFYFVVARSVVTVAPGAPQTKHIVRLAGG